MLTKKTRKTAISFAGLFILLMTLPSLASQPFASLFSERFTLEGERLQEGYNPIVSCEIIEGVPTFHLINNDLLPSNHITALCEDSKGTVFIGTRDIGVVKFSEIVDKRAIFNSFPIDNPKKHGQIAVHSMIYDNRDQRLYVATTGGLFYIIDSDNFSTASCRAVEALGDRTITSVALSKSGDLWAGTSEGLFNEKGEHYTEADGLPCDRIVTLLFDQSDNLWVGTETGLAVRRGDIFRTVDFRDQEKAWITDLALTKPLELMLPLEKYELIVRAFFTGLEHNPAYNDTDKFDLDARMQSMLDVARVGSYSLLIATANGLYQTNTSSHQAEKAKEDWMHCCEFKETGLMYTVNNSAEIINVSPTTRDLARFDINRRFRRRMLGRMLSEVRKDTESAILDEATIADLHGKDEDVIMPELRSRLQALRPTCLLIDKNNLFWLGLDGAGLFVANAKMNTGDFFVKALGAYSDDNGMQVEDESKRRYYLVSETQNVPLESEDMLQGRKSYYGGYWKKFGCFPLRTWVNCCSSLRDDDWNRIASYIGRVIKPKAIFEFIGTLASDPYIFIPAISNGDIPDLARPIGNGGLIDQDEEFIKAHETFMLPIVTQDENNVFETYPENHPETRLNENERELPVEATFDDNRLIR